MEMATKILKGPREHVSPINGYKFQSLCNEINSCTEFVSKAKNELN